MPHITLDGQIIETTQGKSVIEAAYDNGIEIPHFCWHPELSVAGNCRMCLCEVGMPARTRDGELEKNEDGSQKINFIPKLQIACATPVADGMVVKTKSEKAVEAQEAVMEFLLINHPLDCPICDEAGECKLQDYAHRHSKSESRFIEEKNHKLKHQEWGPNVVFDAERCISCSRCIRIAKEVCDQDVLTFVQRGDHVTIELFEGKVFDNPYSMNVIEACPVGALTSNDFRFKSRVWEMSFTDSISYADASGSNTRIGVRNNEILRIEPRTNMYVNKYWLTDDARLNHYDFVNNNRIVKPMMRVNGRLTEVTWDEANDNAYDTLKSMDSSQIFFLASARATNEDNFAFKKFVNENFNSDNIDYLPHIDESFADDKLGTADRTPNAKGVESLGINSKGTINRNNLIENINSGKIKAVYILEDILNDYPELLSALDKLDYLVVHSHNKNELSKKANIVFPASTYAEIEGTYTNKDGRVQHFKPALVTKENLRYMGLNMSRWDKFGAKNDRWTKHENRGCRQSWRILQDLSAKMRNEWNYKKSKDVFADLEANHSEFKGMDYKLLDEYQGLTLGKAENPDPKITNYISHVMHP